MSSPYLFGPSEPFKSTIPIIHFVCSDFEFSFSPVYLISYGSVGGQSFFQLNIIGTPSAVVKAATSE